MSPTAIAIDPEREQDELAAYLGDDFDPERLWRYQETLDRELEELGDEQRLYRTSHAYLYNLTAFAMTGTKLPYLRDLVELSPPPARLLDYGCGIGSDGLALLEAGYEVSFADFDNPSTRYLRWRLERRGLEAPIHDLDAGPVPNGFDAVYAFDVIEHVDDPIQFLERIESRARLVIVNLLDPEPGEQKLHHELPVAEILARVRSRQLERYRIYHGRSHLVAYGPDRARGLGALRSRIEFASGRLKARREAKRATSGGPATR
jgi:2-polyprenyl-3-methyl-5-hydroxy-6-metoxy-1,4-benzoquinol methylase